MQNPELLLLSLRSLGLNFHPSSTGEAISQKLPLPWFIPGHIEVIVAFIGQFAWGVSSMMQTHTHCRGSSPLHNQQEQLTIPPWMLPPGAGTATVMTNNVLVQAGKNHPHMAGEGIGEKTYPFHHIDFIKVNRRIKRVEWVNLLA